MHADLSLWGHDWVAKDAVRKLGILEFEECVSKGYIVSDQVVRLEWTMTKSR